MRRLVSILVILSVLLGWSAFGVAPVQSQSARVAGCRYFPGTGHSVQSEFLAFFDRYNGEVLFGQPRTEALVQSNLTVQYFERVRMELHPENPPQYRVQLTLCGDILGYRQPGIASEDIPPLSNPQRRYYPQTGHTLSYVFLQYYDSHGGLDVFGYPITEMVNERGFVVQYFQRGKMEWHPENAMSSQVTLGALGNEFILRTYVSQQYLAPVASACGSTSVSTSPPIPTPTPVALGTTPASSSGAGPEIQSVPTRVLPTTPANPQGPQPTTAPLPPPPSTDFTVSAAVKYRITGQGGTQTLYVRAVDSQGRGVGNAAVEAIAHIQSENIVVRGTTDGAGSSSLSFNIDYPPPGYTVMIEVRVTYGGQTRSARASFVVWS